MRVTCHSVEEFLECLQGAGVLEDTIRASTTRSPEGSEKVPIVFSVVLHLSTVVQSSDSAEYLLEAGMDCGFDYEDASQDSAGSVKAADLRIQVIEFANARGWKVLPGIIDI